MEPKARIVRDAEERDALASLPRIAGGVPAVGDGAGSSRMLQVRGPAMAARTWAEATMKVDVWGKDMAIIGEALAELAVPAPLFAACVPVYHAALAQGHALHDTASVYAVLERMAGEGAG